MAVGLAGCMGYSIESTDDVESRKNRIEELESTVEEQEATIGELESERNKLEDEIEQKESRISELESANGDYEAEIDSLEEDVEQLTAEKVSKTYQYGYDQQDIAFDDFGKGVEFREDDWRTSMAYMSRAQGRFLAASQAFADALTAAEEEGFTSVTDRIDESNQAVQHYAQASNKYANAAYLYSHDQSSNAQDWDQQAANSFEKGKELTIYEPSEIESSL